MSPKQGETPTIQAPPLHGAGSNLEAWGRYANKLGYDVAGMKRAEIIELVTSGEATTETPPAQTLAEAFDEGYEGGRAGLQKKIADLEAAVEYAREEGYQRAKDELDVTVLIDEAKAEGYREGWDAAQQKNRLPLFEAARKWGFEHAVQIASFRTFLDADRAGLFTEIQAEYPNEKLIRQDRQLIFDQVKRHLQRKKVLVDPTVELTAGRKQEMRRTVKDFEDVVVS